MQTYVRLLLIPDCCRLELFRCRVGLVHWDSSRRPSGLRLSGVDSACVRACVCVCVLSSALVHLDASSFSFETVIGLLSICVCACARA